MTESKSELSGRQQKAIAEVLAGPTVTEALRRAKVGRTQWYTWLNDPQFKSYYETRRKQLTDEAFESVRTALTRAVNVLVNLLDDQTNTDDRLRRQAAIDLIKIHLDQNEMADLVERVELLEKGGI